MMCRVRREVARVGKQHKRRRLRHSLRERIIEDQSEHAAIARVDRIRPNRHLISIALPVPLHRYEALSLKLLLRSREIILHRARPALPLARLLCLRGIRFKALIRRSKCRCCARRAGAGVLDDAEVSSCGLAPARTPDGAGLGGRARVGELTWTSCEAGRSRILCAPPRLLPSGRCTTAAR